MAGGAWASFDEQRKRTLKPGMLRRGHRRPLFGPDAARVLDTQVAVTIFDGRVVYDRAAKPQTDDLACRVTCDADFGAPSSCW